MADGPGVRPFGHDAALIVENPGPDKQGLAFGGSFDIGGDPDSGLFRGYLRSGDEYAPYRYVDRVCLYQPHLSVQSRTGIPSG